MENDLSLLLNLQEIDDHLGELERSRIYLPEMIHNLEKEISDFEQSLEENRATLTESELEQKSLELEIESNRLELEKYQSQMKVIKTNKEYDALIAEIDAKKTEIADKEERVLTLMSRLDELRESIGEFKSGLEDSKANNAEQLETLRAQESTLQAKIDEKMKVRKNVAKDINRQIISIYERVRKGKGGLVVVPVRKKACGGCFKQIPPQRIQEIRRGDRIFSCESCGRIVIWTDESQD